MADKRERKLLPIDRWPTRAEAARMRWFSPVRIGNLEVPRRTWVPAMVPWRATEDGHVSDDVLSWYRRFAAGRPGVLVVEATGVRDIPSGPLLRISHERFVPGLERLVAAVREASGGETRVFIQLIDFLRIRRRPPRDRFLARHLEVGEGIRRRLAEHLSQPAWEGSTEEDVRRHLSTLDEQGLSTVLSARDLESCQQGYRERVTDMHLPHVRDLPRSLPGTFAAAAARARQAGFDGVELHYAHAYTMASFLSALNTRSDGYGGDLEGRVRLPLEVYRAVRREVGESFVVGARFLGDEVVEGGSGIDDATQFGVRFAEAGFDFLSVSKGGKFEDAKQPRVGQAAYPYTGDSGHECMPTVHMAPPGPFGRNVHLAAAIRAALRSAGHDTPVVTAGGICSPYQAEEILEREQADIVASARQSLCDPDWLEKTRLGRGAEVRRCFFTNYCEALDQAHKQVTCQRWDRLEVRDARPVSMSKDGRRRLLPPAWTPPRD